MKTFSLILLAGTSLTPARAQDAPAPAPAPAAVAPAPDETEADAPAAAAPPTQGGQEVIVTGQRLRGEVAGNVEPEVRLNEEQVRAYGASSIGELVDALAPQTRSGRGRGSGPPVVLLNGQRIGGFGEIRDLPPEAIERVDILPEEVALSYGFRADQRVVNIILKENFRSVTTQGTYGFATGGGQSTFEGNGTILRISRQSRWNIDARYSRADSLLESERDLIQSAPSAPFDLLGNVGSSPFLPGSEVDPALSAAAGTPVTVAAVPGSAATGAPALADFVPGANRPNVTDLGRYRTLLPQTESMQLNGTLNRKIFGNVSATFNLRVQANMSESRLGLPSLTLTLPETNPYSPFSDDVTLFRYADAAGPLLRRTRGRTGHGGLTLDSNIKSWRWTFTANYDIARTVTRTDTNADPAAIQARLLAGDPTLNPFAPIGESLLVLAPEDRAESISRSGDAQVVFNGSPFSLPGGPVMASVTLGGNTIDLESETLRAGVTQLRDLSRDRAAALSSLDLPLTSRREGFLAAIGNLSLNLNAEVEHFSDFGTLRTLGYGLRWEPIEPLDFAVNVTDEDGVPSIQQLGDPTVVTPNARVFDFVRGETVDVTRIEGGNPLLVADNRHVFSARATFRPIGGGGGGGMMPSTNLSITANYTKTRIDNPIASFPVATAEIEAAFPGRFVRDGAGRLVQIDSRPINFARSEREDLRWGFNFFMPITVAPAAGGPPGAAAIPGGRGLGGRGGRPPGAGGPRGPGGRGGGGGRRGGGPGGGMFGGPGGGVQLSLFHTWRFNDSVLIRPGVPELDYLDGSAFGGRGGRPRHELEMTAVVFRNGLGAFMNATWQEGSIVRGGPNGQGGTSGDLAFSDFSSVNLTLFADLGQQQGLVRRFDWLKGARVSLSVTNLFDSRIRVRDEAGATPLNYQGDYLDPLGRSIRIGFRKLF
ncbi:MAG TPA: TonB-dependent receptor [Allosphingosinicella sp.]|nr:TonB-dependent receptor [Allosphingosinicella sp.]